MKRNLTELVFVVDRSGSMSGLESDTIGGLNATLQKNREVDGACNVSIVLFANTSEVIVDRKPIEEVAPLTRSDYQVGGCTALLDAVGDAVRYTEKVQTILPESHRAEHVIFTIITDGMENASNHRTYPEVKRMIEAHQEDGWEFIFLGANIDAAAEGGRMGIRADHTSRYVSDGFGSKLAYEAMATAQVSRRTTGAVAPTWNAAPAADAAARGGATPGTTSTHPKAPAKHKILKFWQK